MDSDLGNSGGASCPALTGSYCHVRLLPEVQLARGRLPAAPQYASMPVRRQLDGEKGRSPAMSYSSSQRNIGPRQIACHSEAYHLTETWIDQQSGYLANMRILGTPRILSAPLA